jgi:hypothetical protein
MMTVAGLSEIGQLFFFRLPIEMAAAVILTTSKNRSRRNLLEGISTESVKNGSLLPGHPWEADLTLRVLSGGRWVDFSFIGILLI